MTEHTPFGVRLAGTGSAVPEGILTNSDLEKMVDTSDEWIVQRTGVRERHICGPNETELTLSRDALVRAIDDAGLQPRDLDLLIVGCCTQRMDIPSVACRVSDALDMAPAGAFDLLAACSGFLHAVIIADTMIRAGRYETIGVIGCDVLSNVVDFTERSLSILFGDAAGAVVLTRDSDPTRGCIYQSMQADGAGWQMLYAPPREEDVLEWDRDNPIKIGCLRMQGREVYKFAVKKFVEVITEALCTTRLTVDDISQFICHQSNARIIESAKEKLGLPHEKVIINIDKYGNTSAGSVGLCLDELNRAGKIRPNDRLVLVAFGAGLTWATCIWKV